MAIMRPAPRFQDAIDQAGQPHRDRGLFFQTGRNAGVVPWFEARILIGLFQLDGIGRPHAAPSGPVSLDPVGSCSKDCRNRCIRIRTVDTLDQGSRVIGHDQCAGFHQDLGCQPKSTVIGIDRTRAREGVAQPVDRGSFG